eukprot:2715173-Rhodomonas_salina.1
MCLKVRQEALHPHWAVDALPLFHPSLIVVLCGHPNGSIEHPCPPHFVEGVPIVDGNQGNGRDQFPCRRLSPPPEGR